MGYEAKKLENLTTVLPQVDLVCSEEKSGSSEIANRYTLQANCIYAAHGAAAPSHSRAHDQVCISAPHLRCSFTSCKAKIRTGTREELIDHENTTHSIWICTHCEKGFKTWRIAVSHVLESHDDFANENTIRRLWISHFDMLTKDSVFCVDLHDPAAQPKQQQQQKIKPSLPTLNESVIRLITAHATAFLSFLGDQGLSEPSCSLSLHMNSFLSKIKTGQVTALSTNPVAAASQQHIIPPLTIPKQDSISAINFTQQHGLPKKSPTRTMTPPISTCKNIWSGFDPLLDYHRSPDPLPDSEPQLPTSIPLDNQIEYFKQIQALIINCSFKFYTRHKAQLDCIRDRNQVPLCRKPGYNQGHYITENSNHYHSPCGYIPIEKKDDLTLPQWTNLLRRLQDAKPKGLTKDMDVLLAVEGLGKL
ncbi:hypothetical protein BZA77DRAFT_342228 [Pyronema omphalodes]|nr:hypothetical protein BZA77DRAFT_342228 [Pyronema omphalodes]